MAFADGRDLPILPIATTHTAAPDWFTLQFGGVQRQIIDLKDLENSCSELARAIRGVVADAAQAPRGPRSPTT